MLGGGRERGGRGSDLPVAALLLSSLVLSALGKAQESAPPPEAAQVRRVGAVMYFAEEVDLGLLAYVAAEAISTPLEYDPEKLSGKVRMQGHVPYTAEEAWELLNRELAARGQTTVQPPDSVALRVVPVEQAASLARLEAADLAGAKAGFVRVLRPLHSRSPEQVSATVQLLLTKGSGTVAATDGAGALLIADFRPQVSQALAALDVLDAPAAEPVVEEMRLEHTTPVALGALLERVTNSRKVVTGEALRGQALPLADAGSLLIVAPAVELGWWRETIARFDRPEPVVTIHYTPRRFGAAETARLIEEVVKGDKSLGNWRVVVDQLTGSVIVTTTTSLHGRINDLLNRLEATERGPRSPMRAYPVQHRRVAELMELLQELLDAGVLAQAVEPAPGTPTTQPAAQPKAPQGPTAPIPVKPPPIVGTAPDSSGASVTLTADEGTNRIIAFGEARLLDQLGLLIEALDVQHAQVLVEALVVNLTETDTRSLGVELRKLGSHDGTLYHLSSLFGLGAPDPTLGTIPPPMGSGFSGVVLDPGEFSAVVRALETLNRGRSLTIPKVLVNNNQPATLDSTVQTPYAAVNASTTVATTSFGGTFDAGTSIMVQPQVTDGDQILLAYTISISNFVGQSSDPSLPPPRQENKLQAIATVPDGHTVVVGGLEIESDTSTSTRVPILGSVPLLGHLFENRSKTKSRTRFFVFLRCNVMRDASFADLRYTSQPAMAAAGLEDGWPTLEPRVIR